MVSINQKAIFCHVPKNGGSSVSAAVAGVDQYWPMHVPWRCLADIGKPGFGFIRNPWHRMVSLHYFLCSSPPRHIQRVDPVEIHRMGFKRWLLEGENWMSNEPIDGEIWIRQNAKYLPVSPTNTYRNIALLPHPYMGMPPQQRRPAMWWLDGLPAENIGKVESIKADLDRIGNRLGFLPRKLSHTNQTRRKPTDWRAEHDSETVEFIRTHHARDIKQGGYEWDG